MKINLYQGIEYIKNFFKSKPEFKFTSTYTAEDDALLLTAMCEYTAFLYSRNGTYYWYYFTSNTADLDIAYALLKNNKIAAQRHNSRYNTYAPRPVIRVKNSTLKKDDNAKKFICSIESAWQKKFSPEVKERLEHLRSLLQIHNKYNQSTDKIR